jgi:hypothetical protein
MDGTIFDRLTQSLGEAGWSRRTAVKRLAGVTLALAFAGWRSRQTPAQTVICNEIGGRCRNDGECCAVGLRCCSGRCADPLNDRRNCGACGSVCRTSFCVEGECGQCPTGQTLCFRTCMNTSTSATNCGACGRACRGGLTCVDGACVPA